MSVINKVQKGNFDNSRINAHILYILFFCWIFPFIKNGNLLIDLLPKIDI